MTRCTRLFALLLACLPVLSLRAQTPQLQTRDHYLLHSGDQLTIEYTYTPEFNTIATIQPDGFLPLKVGNEVQVAGKTVLQAKALIEQSASARLKDPVISITLTDFQHPYFTVSGEVYTPAKYDLRDNLTVLQGLMMAGGIKQTGKEKQVVVLHGVNSPEPAVYVLDLKQVQSRKIFEHDMPLSSGDVIYVPRNKLTRAIQVMSLINAPASYANVAVYGLR